MSSSHILLFLNSFLCLFTINCGLYWGAHHDKALTFPKSHRGCKTKAEIQSNTVNTKSIFSCHLCSRTIQPRVREMAVSQSSYRTSAVVLSSKARRWQEPQASKRLSNKQNGSCSSCSGPLSMNWWQECVAGKPWSEHGQCFWCRVRSQTSCPRNIQQQMFFL